MTKQHRNNLWLSAITLGTILGLFFASAPVTHAAIVWDGEAGTQWWFDPVNWNRDSNNNTSLPPGNSATGATDAQINIDTSGIPGGEGVVYDPANDPNFVAASSLTYPTGSSLATLPGFMRDYGPETIYRLYTSRNVTNSSLLTIKSGDLAIESTTIIGRSGSVTGSPNSGRVNQLGGSVRLPLIALDMGNSEASGYGNGTWDYRGGTLEVSELGGSGLRLSAGGSSGPGGIGRFIMHNPTSAGHVRAFDFNVAANAGTGTLLPDGINTGVGVVEFHYENGGTRPIQVDRNLLINNGSTDTGAVRSAKLQLVLDSAPTVNGSGVPQDLGLFDVAFSDASGTNTTGAGSLGDFFSSADGSTLYDQGATVSATFNGSTYNWTISYAGNITWSNADNGTVGSISDSGGVDVVLKGLSSVIGPPGLAGDFNNDGKVDAADYPIWRKNSSNASLPNDNGLTTQADRFNLWRANFGKPPGAGSGLSASAVPEPCSCWLALCLAFGGLLTHRRRSTLA